MAGLPSTWIKDTPTENRANFEAAIRNSTVALGRLKQIVKDKVEGLATAESSISDFDDTAWSHKQAFRNGQRSSYAELLKLLDFIP